MWMVAIMQQILWKFIKHKDITSRDLEIIAFLKDQHWIHGLDSQIDWIKANMKDDDYHLLGIDSTNSYNKLSAYLALCDLKIIIDDVYKSAIGLGCVCVDKSLEHKGFGKILLEEASQFIRKSNKNGVLLCKKNLIGFYEKCGWNNLDYQQAFVSDTIFNNNIMILGSAAKCTQIKIDRIF